MADLKTWTGGCHCGRVRYEAELSLDGIVACNCSICQKRGSLLAFVPQSQFRLLAGEDALTDYQFNKKVIHHLFCATCGVASFAHGEKPGRRANGRGECSLPRRGRCGLAQAEAIRRKEPVTRGIVVGPRAFFRRAGLNRVPGMGARAV